MVHALCSQQKDENMVPNFILLHRPNVEVDFGKLHHAGALYHRAANLKDAIQAHENMIAAIKSMGVPYGIVGEILQRNEHKLREVVEKVYQFKTETTTGDETTIAQQTITKEYKQSILKQLPTEELLEIALLRPTVHLEYDPINTHIATTHTSVSPLTNIVFTRDQSITTAKGVILGALNSKQRQFETELMKHVWEELGVELVGVIKAPGKAEGGDFLAVSSNMSMIGQGLRTNAEAIKQMLDGKMFGTKKVVVVVDKTDLHQSRMHLDTFFNIIKPGFAVVEANVLNEVGPFKRYVEEYTLTNDGSKYELTKQTSFIDYLKKDMKYKLISVSPEDQDRYMINFLLMGESEGKHRIISTNPGLANLLSSSEHKEELKDVSVTYVEYDGLTALYGAAHCTTQAFRCNHHVDAQGNACM